MKKSTKKTRDTANLSQGCRSLPFVIFPAPFLLSVDLHINNFAGRKGFRTGGIRTGGIRTGGIKEKRDTGKLGSVQEGCKTGQMLDRRDTGHVRCRTGGIQDRRDTEQVGCRKGGIQ